jgi:D-hydroxyproline dehydrogenase subunit beta
MAEPFDDAVVGAGILGLAHAYHLARRGRRVAVFERGPQAQGASVRNFGMIWPIGQAPGRMHRLALRSRDHWLEVLPAAGLWHAQTGSLHLAYRDDEAAVLNEFAEAAPGQAIDVRVLTPGEVRERAPAVRPDGLRLGLFSPAELCVDPREVIAGLPAWLTQEHGVTFYICHTVTAFDGRRVRAGCREWAAGRLWVCAGDDLQTLYPEALNALGLRRCKLQMMRTQPLGPHLRIGPMLAAGLTLRHYPCFAACPSLPALKARVAAETPEFDRYGIHVMAAQNGRGEVVIGDSHEYDDAIEPFDKEVIDDLILSYLRTFLELPGLSIAARWHGTYVKHATEPVVTVRPAPNVVAVTGVGGAGMTLSFGVAEETVGQVLGEA